MMVRAGVAAATVGLVLALAGTAQGATFTRDAGTTQSFSNTASIPIDDGHCDFDEPDDSYQGTANPYPSTVDVSGMSGPITDVNVTLKDLSHRYLQDLRAMLVSPDGKKVLFLHGAGDGEVDDVTFKFDDAWDDEALHTSGSVAPSFGDLGCPFIRSPRRCRIPLPPGRTTRPRRVQRQPGERAVEALHGRLLRRRGRRRRRRLEPRDHDRHHDQRRRVPRRPARAGAASSYPSTIAVAGLAGNITDVNLTLKNYSHQVPGDVRMLLVGPAGQKVLVLHHIGTIPHPLTASAIEDQTLVLDARRRGRSRSRS